MRGPFCSTGMKWHRNPVCIFQLAWDRVPLKPLHRRWCFRVFVFQMKKAPVDNWNSSASKTTSFLHCPTLLLIRFFKLNTLSRAVLDFAFRQSPRTVRSYLHPILCFRQLSLFLIPQSPPGHPVTLLHMSRRERFQIAHSNTWTSLSSSRLSTKKLEWIRKKNFYPNKFVVSVEF